MAAVQIIFDIFMMFGLNEFDVKTMNNEKGESMYNLCILFSYGCFCQLTIEATSSNVYPVGKNFSENMYKILQKNTYGKNIVSICSMLYHACGCRKIHVIRIDPFFSRCGNKF